MPADSSEFAFRVGSRGPDPARDNCSGEWSGPIQDQQPTTNNQQPSRYLTGILVCIAVALATVAGCAAERGTIGAQLGRQDDGRLYIRETPAGLAAAKAGLRPGDEITLINGRDVRGMDEKGIHTILSGEVGDTVKLTVLRGERVLHVTLQRTPAPVRRKSNSGSSESH